MAVLIAHPFLISCYFGNPPHPGPVHRPEENFRQHGQWRPPPRRGVVGAGIHHPPLSLSCSDSNPAKESQQPNVIVEQTLSSDRGR